MVLVVLHHSMFLRWRLHRTYYVACTAPAAMSVPVSAVDNSNVDHTESDNRMEELDIMLLCDWRMSVKLTGRCTKG